MSWSCSSSARCRSGCLRIRTLRLVEGRLCGFIFLNFFQSGGNDGDLGCICSLFIIHRTENDISRITGKLLNIGSSLIRFYQTDITGNIDNDIACTLNGCLKQRARNCLLYRINCLVIAVALADTDMCDTLILHDCGDIRKVKIDKTWHIDQIRDALYALLKNLISFLERIRHGCPAVYDLKKTVVRDDNQCIDILLKALDTLVGVIHTLLCFKLERLRNNTYSKTSEFLRKSCNDWCCTCTGTAAHTAGDENHITVLHDLSKIFCTFFSSLLTDLRLCTGTETLGQLLSDLYKLRSLAELKCLTVGINADEFDSDNILIDHPVNGIIARSAYTDYKDFGSGFILIRFYLKQGISSFTNCSNYYLFYINIISGKYQ